MAKCEEISDSFVPISNVHERMNFPPETLQQIFKFLESDTVTLFSCILVCRDWAKQAVPVLWGNPFKCHENHLHECRIIDTFICFLDEDDKNILVLWELELLIVPIPLFEYPAFIKHLEYREFYDVVSSWLEIRQLPPYSPTQCLSLAELLCQVMFQHTSGGLESLSLIEAEGTDEMVPFVQFAGVAKTISSLKKFKLELYEDEFTHYTDIDKSNIKDLLDLMQSECTKIRSLEIDFGWFHVAKHAINLVSVQENLEYISLYGLKEEHREDVFPKLVLQAQNLHYFACTNLQVSALDVEVLAKFINLKTLIICAPNHCNNSNDISDNFWEPLFKSNIRLKKFFCDYPNERIDLPQRIIEISAEFLQYLALDPTKSGCFELLSQHCPNLRSLAVRVEPDNIKEFITSLPSFKRLKRLQFLTQNVSDFREYKKIAINLPNMVWYLGIRNRTLSVVSLESLLRYLKKPIRYFALHAEVTNQHIKSLSLCAKEKQMIKKVGVRDHIYDWLGEEKRFPTNKYPELEFVEYFGLFDSPENLDTEY
ncbi:hypothetical protein G9A89_001428 [Geosiphon pyriformis]|nr:hypothetical protein G9A89_001428 [Geosiphon pyriformis]